MYFIIYTFLIYIVSNLFTLGILAPYDKRKLFKVLDKELNEIIKKNNDDMPHVIITNTSANYLFPIYTRKEVFITVGTETNHKQYIYEYITIFCFSFLSLVDIEHINND
jgi:hypothetical protein